MKLKAIFILFNIVIVGSFLIVFLMPIFILGADFSLMFWSKNWYLALIFLVVLAALNAFFIRNWKLFSILDREAWPDLKAYLEKEIFEKGRVTNQYVRLYIQACLIGGKVMEIKRLEEKVREKGKTGLIGKNVLAFGLPYMVEQDAAAMEAYYGAYADVGGKERHWVRWCHAFAMMLSGKTAEAEEKLTSVFESSRDNLLRLIALYLLSGCGGGASGDFIEKGKKDLRAACRPEDFDAAKQKQSDNYLILVLSRLVEDAKLWLWPGENVDSSR